jgi:uncharacterized protein
VTRNWRILCFVFVVLVSCAREAVAIPSDDLLNSLHATGNVNDFAGVLSQTEKDAIEARCRQLSEKTGAQLAVVTLKSLEGGSLEDFTIKLATRWTIGQKGQNNGILLLVAMQEHRSRIEVGYGLEPIIPDVLAGRIVDEQLRPQFRAGQYGAGLLAAVNAIAELVEKGEPADRAALTAQHEGAGDPFVAVLFLTMFVAVGGLILGAGLEQKMAPAVLFGSVFSGGPMLMGLLIAGLIAPAIHLPIALVMAAIGWHLAENQPPTKRRSALSSPGFGGWNWGSIGSSSGGWSGGGWSSGGGGGGFGGFGGGSFGGGGASGSW